MELIAADCQSCGAQLHVNPEDEQVQCPFCSATYVIRRAGNTIALKGIEASLGKIETSTGTTALELRILRYRDELRELQSEREKRGNKVGWMAEKYRFSL